MTDLDAKQRDALSDSQFAYIAPDGSKHLPIENAAHVRAALARFDQTDFADADCKAKAKAKIMAAAKKYGVDVSDDDTAHTNAEGPTVGDVHVNVPVGNDTKPKKKTVPAPTEDDPDGDGIPDQDDEDAVVMGDTVPAPERPGRPFLTKLRELMRGKVKPEEYDEMIRTARAHAGGAGKAASRAKAAGELAVLCADGGAWRLFTDLGTYSVPPEWIPYLPKPGQYQHPSWGTVKIDAARNRNFVEQFQRGIYQKQLPLDAEHQTTLSGAMGWIDALRQNSDGSVDAHVAWTDRGRKMMADQRFKYVSPSWFDEWPDPVDGTRHKDVLFGGALTTRPFFKEQSLRPLVASERGLFAPAADAAPGDSAPLIVFVELAPAPAGQERNTMAEPQTPAQDPAADQAKRFAELEAKLAAEQAVRASQETAIKQASEKIAALEAAARRKRFTDEVLGKGAASGARWFGEPDKHVSLMDKLALTFGEDSPELTQYVETQRAAAEAIKQSGLFSELGSDHGQSAAGGSADDKVTALAKTYAEEHKISKEQAYSRVLAEHPELQREIAAEMGLPV